MEGIEESHIKKTDQTNLVTREVARDLLDAIHILNEDEDDIEMAYERGAFDEDVYLAKKKKLQAKRISLHHRYEK